MQFIHVIPHPHRGAITPGRGIVKVIFSHCTSAGTEILTDLDGLNYQGAEYPFEINFNYDVDLHQVTEATYVAVGTGFKNQITSMVFSADENHVNITGPSLTISASLGDNGKYVGSMTRGDHSGSIEMYL